MDVAIMINPFLHTESEYLMKQRQLGRTNQTGRAAGREKLRPLKIGINVTFQPQQIRLFWG